MSYIILRGRWYDIVLNVHAPTEDKSDDMKDSFHEELDCVQELDPLQGTTQKRRFQTKSGERRYFQTNNWE
jgi:hypothetical protein